MVRPSEYVKSGAGKTAAKQTAKSRAQPQAMSLLQGRLQAIQKSGSKSQLAEALRTSKGGSPSVGAKILGGVAFTLGLPGRGVTAGIEETGNILAGTPRGHEEVRKHIMDPEYGFGHVVEKVAPTANPWVKRAAGLGGDIVLDPLTYITFGASPETKLLGRTPGLIRMAENAADAAELAGDLTKAGALRQLATKAGEHGASRLPKEEFDILRELAAKEGFKDVRYGATFHVPFTKFESPLGARNPLSMYGRKMEQAGSALAKAGNASKLGELIGGQRIGPLRALRSGNLEAVREASRVLDAWDYGTGRSAGVGRNLFMESRELEARATKAKLDPVEAMTALGERPVGDELAGPTYSRIMREGTEEQKQVLNDYGRWFDSHPEGMADVTQVGEARLNWLHDASKSGRAYVPRSLSDEFVENVVKPNMRARSSQRIGERAWFEKKALGIGDKVGDGEFERTIAKPGTLMEDGVTIAPSQEDQIRSVLKAQFGDQYVEPFEQDLFKSVAKYREGLTTQVRDYSVQNYLRDKGISNELVTWKVDDLGNRVPGSKKGGITITRYAGKLDKKIAKAEAGMKQAIDRLNTTRQEMSAALDAQDQVGYQRAKNAVERQMQAVHTAASQRDSLTQELGRVSADQAKIEARAADARRVWTEATEEARQAKERFDAFKTKAFEDSPQHWDELTRLSLDRIEAERKAGMAALARDNVSRVQDEVSNNLAVIDDIDKLIASGQELTMDHPLYDLVDDVTDRERMFGMAPEDVPLEHVRNLLQGQADAMMDELHGYAKEFPGTADPAAWRREASAARKRKSYWQEKLTAALLNEDSEAGNLARGNYEEAAKEYSYRRELLSRQKDGRGAPVIADVQDPEWQQHLSDLADEAAVSADAAGTTEEQTMAVLAHHAEAWLQTNPEYLLNPAGGNTWHHAWRDAPLSFTGEFPLKAKLEGDTAWLDYLFAPSITANWTFADAWTEGAPGAEVQQLLARTGKDRIAFFGIDNMTMDETLAHVQPEGAIGKFQGAQVGVEGTVTPQFNERMRAQHVYGGDQKTVTSLSGPGYDALVNDMTRRLFDENPGQLRQFIEVMRTEVARTGSEAQRDPSYWYQTIDAFKLAGDIQSYARGAGHVVNFDEALHTAVSHMDNGLPIKDFDYAALLDPGWSPLPMPGDHMPFGARMARRVVSKSLPDEWRLAASESMRSSLARDADIIMFVNYEQPALPIVQILPTAQHVVEPVDSLSEAALQTHGAPKSLMQAAEDMKRAYTGKIVDQAKYQELEDLENTANYMQRITYKMFTSADKDIYDNEAFAQITASMFKQASEKADAELVIHDNKVKALAEATEAFKVRAQVTEEPEARVAHLRAREKQLEATLEDHRVNWQAVLEKRAEVEQHLGNVLRTGWEGFGYNRQAPSTVVEMLADITKSYDPATGQGLNKFLRHFDKVNNWMKGWLTSSMGFQTRNAFGGMFNNWLAGVDMSHSPMEWGRIYFATRPGALARRGEQLATSDKVIAQIMHEHGFTGSGLFHSELGGMHKASLNPLAGIAGGENAFVLPYATRKMGEQVVEPWLRGTLAYDALRKSVKRGRFSTFTDLDGRAFTDLKQLDNMAPEQIEAFTKAVREGSMGLEMINLVDKYHFNYDDLSRGERQVGRRVIPFYTWTRKNVPLQIEAMFTDPGKAINRYMAVKRNLELGTEDEQIVPSYFAEQAMIHLPWKVGGNDTYGTVELPFKDPFKAADVTGQLVGMLNPLIKAPMEAMAGKQFFSDVPLTDEYKPMPTTWLPLIPFMAAGAKLPFIPWSEPVRGKGGQWMMRDKDAYIVGQYLPFLAQTRRLLPSEPKYTNRLWTTTLSYMMGVNVRTNTPQDQESEIFRRSDTLEKVVNDLEATGRIPPKPTRQRRRSHVDLASMLANIESRPTRQPTPEEVPAYEA